MCLNEWVCVSHEDANHSLKFFIVMIRIQTHSLDSRLINFGGMVAQADRLSGFQIFLNWFR